MKTKKWVTVLIVVAACLLFTCGFMTGACFLVNYLVQRSLGENVDTCFAALQEGFSVDEDCRSFGFDMELRSFSGRPENMEDIEEIYDDLSSGESAFEFTLTADFGGGSPLIRSRADTANGDGSLVYLYNGNVYVCKTKYAYGDYYWQIVHTMDGKSVFGDMDWSDIENIDWQSPEISLDDEDVAEFLSVMGIEGGSDYEMFAELLNDPESMFLNAEKYPGDDGDVFVFKADDTYFKDYFDEAESELKDRYKKAKIGNRRVYAYMKSRQNEMRETLVLSFDFKMSGINTTVNVALDISVRFGVPAPDVVDDVLIYEAYAEGGEGAVEMARVVVDTIEKRPSAPLRFAYDDSDSVAEKIRKVACNLYGAASVTLAAPAQRRIKQIEALGLGHLPVCIAKTQYSFSADAKRYGAVSGFDFLVRDVVINAGAEMIVAIAGDILRMPGLPKNPQANHIDYVDGEIIGLS